MRQQRQAETLFVLSVYRGGIKAILNCMVSLIHKKCCLAHIRIGWSVGRRKQLFFQSIRKNISKIKTEEKVF